MNTNINVGISGEYKFVITNTETGEETETEWIPNLITDYGLASLCQGTTNNYWAFYCSIGTGNTAPAFTDTQLVNRTSTVSYGGTGIYTNTPGTSPDYIRVYTQSFVFPQGASAGQTIREVGIGRLESGYDLISRALILDGNGDPSEFTLSAIDRLTVYYRLNLQLPLLTTGSFDLNGTTIYYRGTGFNLTSSSAPFGLSNAVLVYGLAGQFKIRSITQNGFAYQGLYPITAPVPAATDSYLGTAFSAVTSTKGSSSSVVTSTTVTNTVTVLDVYGNVSIGAVTAYAGYSGSSSEFVFFKFYSDAGFTTPYAITKTNTQTLTFSYTWILSRA